MIRSATSCWPTGFPETLLRVEDAMPLIDQDRYLSGKPVGQHDVAERIIVHVMQFDGRRVDADRVRGDGAEDARSCLEGNEDLIGRGCGDDEIAQPVAVQIGG